MTGFPFGDNVPPVEKPLGTFSDASSHKQHCPDLVPSLWAGGHSGRTG
jgi:hypothetical protein